MTSVNETDLKGSEQTLYTWFIVLPLLVIILLFVYPLLALLAESFSSPAGWFGYYRDAFNSEIFLRSIVNSLKFATITALLTILLGYPVALLIASVRSRVGRLLLLLVLVPFWTSALVRSYAWLAVLGRTGIINSSLQDAGIIDSPLELLFNDVGVIIGMVHVMLPYMILPILSALTRVNKDLLYAAESLGASPGQTFYRVLLPLTFHGVLGGAVLVFVLALGFFITPALMGGPQQTVTALVIHEQITEKLQWGQAAAASAILLLLTVGTFAVMAKLFGLRREMSVKLGD